MSGFTDTLPSPSKQRLLEKIAKTEAEQIRRIERLSTRVEIGAAIGVVLGGGVMATSYLAHPSFDTTNRYEALTNAIEAVDDNIVQSERTNDYIAEINARLPEGAPYRLTSFDIPRMERERDNLYGQLATPMLVAEDERRGDVRHGNQSGYFLCVTAFALSLLAKIIGESRFTRRKHNEIDAAYAEHYKQKPADLRILS